MQLCACRGHSPGLSSLPGPSPQPLLRARHHIIDLSFTVLFRGLLCPLRHNSILVHHCSLFLQSTWFSWKPLPCLIVLNLPPVIRVPPVSSARPVCAALGAAADQREVCLLRCTTLSLFFKDCICTFLTHFCLALLDISNHFSSFYFPF